MNQRPPKPSRHSHLDEQAKPPRPALPLVRWQQWYESKSPVLHFGLKFTALMALYYILVLTPFFDRLLYTYLEGSAWLSNALLQGLGQQSHVVETSIRSARFAITVRRGCDAIEPSWFFCAAVLSFPAPFARQLMGIVIGGIFLQILNLIRIVSLYFIGSFFPRLFSTAHLEIWPAVFIITAMALWISWIRWARATIPPESHAAA